MKYIFLLITLWFSNIYYGYGKSNDSLSQSSNNGRLAIGLGAGANGIGGQVSLRATNALSLRVGYYKGNVNTSFETKFGADKVLVDINAAPKGITAIAELYPSQKSSFHFLLGAIFSSTRILATSTPTDSQSYGYIKVSGEEAGSLEFHIIPPLIMPVVGIGFGRAIPKRRVGMSLDMGFAYMGPPKVELEANESLTPSDNESNQQLVSEAFSDFKFYPFVNVHLNIKLF